MSKFVMTQEMQGEKPFRCFQCNKQLAYHIEGECIAIFKCPRCKAKVTLELHNPLPSALALRSGVLTKQ